METRHGKKPIHLNTQENLFIAKTKTIQSSKDGHLPVTKRAVLGNLNGNINIKSVATKTKTTILAEAQKPTTTELKPESRSYKNVAAKIDSRRPLKTTSTNLKIYEENDPKQLQRQDSLTVKTGIIASKLKQTKISNPSSKLLSKENLLSKKEKMVEIKTDSKCKINPTLNTKVLTKQSEIVRRNFPKIESYSADLLEGVEDIDSKDSKNPILIGVYVKDIYNYLMELEIKYSIAPQHLDGQFIVTPKMRAKLIDWLIEVHYQFNLVLETLHMTVSIIDRYFQAVKTTKRTEIQLVGITALFIASKYEELFVPNTQDFIIITDNTYTKAEILKCERTILAKLQFNLGKPLPLHFERRFIKAAGTMESRYHWFAKYLIDLCLVEYDMAHYRPSEIAASAVCLSMSVLSDTFPKECWTPTLIYYSSYKYVDIKPIIEKMARIVIAAETNNLKAVRSKYSSSKFGKVTSFPELKGNLIKTIANYDQDY